MFSNSKPASFELMSMLIGEGNQMVQESMSMLQVQSTTGQGPGAPGTLMLMGQKTLPGDVEASFQGELGAPSLAQFNYMLSLKKDFDGCHLQY